MLSDYHLSYPSPKHQEPNVLFPLKRVKNLKFEDVKTIHLRSYSERVGKL
jgi:hypothetical protein